MSRGLCSSGSDVLLSHDGDIGQHSNGGHRCTGEGDEFESFKPPLFPISVCLSVCMSIRLMLGKEGQVMANYYHYSPTHNWD